MDAAIGFVVARGDPVERARLSWLRTGTAPSAEVNAKAELGQSVEGGWPAVWGQVASVDATCFHLTELDDLGLLDSPSGRKALDWMAKRQGPDGTWEEDESLAAEAPAWARPGDPEARLYLTAGAAFWLAVADQDARAAGVIEAKVGSAYSAAVSAGAQVIADSLGAGGTWPSFLVTGWLGAAVLYSREMFYESARMQIVLTERLPGMSPADVAWMAATLRRVGLPDDDWLLVSARRRLAETQGTDGGWRSDDGEAFDVHTTLAAIRACR